MNGLGLFDYSRVSGYDPASSARRRGVPTAVPIGVGIVAIKRVHSSTPADRVGVTGVVASVSLVVPPPGFVITEETNVLAFEVVLIVLASVVRIVSPSSS